MMTKDLPSPDAVIVLHRTSRPTKPQPESNQAPTSNWSEITQRRGEGAIRALLALNAGLGAESEPAFAAERTPAGATGTAVPSGELDADAAVAPKAEPMAAPGLTTREAAASGLAVLLMITGSFGIGVSHEAGSSRRFSSQALTRSAAAGWSLLYKAASKPQCGHGSDSRKRMAIKTSERPKPSAKSAIALGSKSCQSKKESAAAAAAESPTSTKDERRLR
jgi:hypothetical protein